MTTGNESFFTHLGIVPPVPRGADAFNRIEGEEHESRTVQGEAGLTDAPLTVPLCIMAVAALFG